MTKTGRSITISMSKLAQAFGFKDEVALYEASQSQLTEGGIDWYLTRLPDGRYAAWDDAEIALDRVFIGTKKRCTRHIWDGISDLMPEFVLDGEFVNLFANGCFTAYTAKILGPDQVRFTGDYYSLDGIDHGTSCNLLLQLKQHLSLPLSLREVVDAPYRRFLLL